MRLRSRAPCPDRTADSGDNDIARKPNYDFERRERERNKAAESAKKAQAKADKRAAGQGTPDAVESDDPQVE
jgi:hypothetical protein